MEGDGNLLAKTKKFSSETRKRIADTQRNFRAAKKKYPGITLSDRANLDHLMGRKSKGKSSEHGHSPKKNAHMDSAPGVGNKAKKTVSISGGHKGLRGAAASKHYYQKLQRAKKSEAGWKATNAGVGERIGGVRGKRTGVKGFSNRGDAMKKAWATRRKKYGSSGGRGRKAGRRK